MRKLTLAVVLSTAFATTAMANEMPETGLIDAQQVFHMEDAQPMQLAMLSEQEMRETEGAVAAPGAVVGGFMGGGQYLSSCSIVGNCSAWGFGYNVISGAALGAIGGTWVTIGRAAWGFNGSIGVGIGNGMGTQFGLW